MTDDKGAGEDIYKHSVYCHAMGDTWKCLKCAYDRGVKAERERCAKIVETENVKFYENGFISQKWIICGEIAEKIRGGQDGGGLNEIKDTTKTT